MTLGIAVVLGALIGVSLGALGGGGSILTVPALVYVVGEPAREATTASLVIVGVTALVGALGHARSGHVRWKVGLAFGVIGVAASYLGTALNRRIDPNVLLLCFASIMIVAAVAMLRQISTRRPPAAMGDAKAPRASSLATLTRAQAAEMTGVVAVKVVAAALVVGFLTGLLGVGGGFIVVPVLVVALDLPMPIAVGTSLLVIGLNSAAALAARAGGQSFHWAVIVPFTAAAIAGSLVGEEVAARLSATVLTRAFAGLLLAVAAYVAVRSAAAS